MRSLSGAGLGVCAGLAWLCAGQARAQVTQPNGDIVPRDSKNGEVQLYTLFSQRGESVDWINDASATPDTFSPLCDFRATLVLKESGIAHAVGWYNVDPAASAPPTEIYEMVPIDASVGQTVTGADIRGDARYAGGLIGFALIRTPPHYSQARYNTVCTACSNPGPWHLALTYASDTPNAYYLAFEDGTTTSSGFNNDGDYNDKVFFLEGLVCAGAGEPCSVPGAQGVCRDGITECERSSGEQVCKQLTQPADERCDGFDNDCDGDVDEGDGLCPGDDVCSRGVCVPRCGTFEFPCLAAPYTLCSDGLCIEPACEGVQCAEGQACVGGRCVDPCAGVSCPGDQVCRVGKCVDPCADVQCPDQHICQRGACVLDCDCAGCEGDAVCDAASKRCVQPACEGVACPAGSHCEAGSCRDDCADATCPPGEVCEMGGCAPAPEMDGPGGARDAGGEDAGPPPTSADASTRRDSGAGAADAGSNDAAGGGLSASKADGGCSCRAAGQSSRPGPLGALGAAALLSCLAARRRRRLKGAPRARSH